MMKSPEALVRAVLAEHLETDVSSIHADHHLADDLGLTPLAVVLVALDLEDVENVVLPFEQLTQVKTVSDLARFVAHAREGITRYAV
jgi:acyl carrier protein